MPENNGEKEFENCFIKFAFGMFVMKRMLFFPLLLLCTAAFARGADYPHLPDGLELRLGVGDMFFETMIWHNQPHISVASLPDGLVVKEKTHHRYSPHISVEGTYSLLPWLCAGLALDIQGTGWDLECYDRSGKLGADKHSFYNLCIMPVARFNYFRRPNVQIYSAIAAGIDVNGGTETDYRGRKTVVGAAMDLRLAGVEAGAGHWWGFFDIGGTFALKNTNTIFLMGSQLMKVGLSYKF